MKKYYLGLLTIRDKEFQDTKEEIVIELLDRIQKYDAEGKMTFEDPNLTIEQKLTKINLLREMFCGLSDFLGISMGIDARCDDNVLYTEKVYIHFHYWTQMLEIEVSQKQCKEKVNVNE